ncbi:TonB-dependent siderophore receptor [Duganella sp. HH101]|uniref:TonB-dependent receptor plug domain-containing protein n=1 Tax=Duganella sp. HH101 TaxID=1781066 RepID=UPI0008750735|nr:TonB-dependent receptor [Duganella sp. HH101]OFA05134.1 colicin I receptor precursor [Duganella sp. HH101]
MRGLKPGLLLAAVCCSPVAQAQQPAQQPAPASLEELLRQTPTDITRGVEESTSSRFAQSASEAPSVTYVVTDTDITRHGMRNMADVLRSMPGLYVTGDGNFVYVGARGLGRPGDYNSRLLFLIDGMRVNENIYDAGLLGSEFFVDVDLIDRVEYAPGPGSALYGNNAFFGVVNIITKGADKLHGVQVRASADSDRLREVRASVGHRWEQGGEGWLALSAFKQSDIAAQYPLPPGFDRPVKDHNWDRGQRLLGMGRYRGFTLRAGLSHREQGTPGFLPPEAPAPIVQNRNVFNNSFLSAEYQRDLGNDWSLYGAVSSKRSDYLQAFPYIHRDLTPFEFDKRSLGRWYNVDLRISTQRWRDHELMAGFEYQYDRTQRIIAGPLGEQPDAEFYGDNRRRGLFVQDSWRLNDSHRVTLGLRRDATMMGGTNINPRFAWIWSGVPDASLKLMYGSAYREANLFEYQVNAPWEAPLPTPERVRTLEVAWDHALSHNVQYRASVYASRLRDLISVGQESGVFENSGLIRSLGAELGLERRWAGGQQWQTALSLQRTSDALGQRLNNSPRALLKMLYSQPLQGDRLRLSWQALSESRRVTATTTLPGYTLLNGTLLWRQSEGVNVALSLYNIGNVRYFDQPDGVGPPLRQEGRVLRLSLTRQFGP